MSLERSYPTSKVRGGSREELPHVQGNEQQLHFARAAKLLEVKRYPTSKVRETQVRQQVLREASEGRQSNTTITAN